MGHLAHSVRLAVGGVAALTLLLSGCAGLPGYPPATNTPLAQLVRGVDCQAPNLNNSIVAPKGGPPRTDRTSAHPDAPEPGMVPTGFEPVAAYRCTFRGSVDNPEGRWSAVTVETLKGDFDPLLTALAASNDRASLNQACTADMEFVPELWLENANGDALRAAWPRTACMKTKPETGEALENLTVTDTTLLPLILQITPEALESGCSMSAGKPEQSLLFGTTALQTYLGPDEIRVDPQPIPVPLIAVASYDGVDGATVCFYTVDPTTNPEQSALSDIEGRPFDDQALSLMKSLQLGSFASAATLSADAAALLPAAASAEPAPACTAPLTRFAVLWPTRGGDPLDSSIQVEQDGCARVFVPGSPALVTPSALLAALNA